ncbi:MAG: hypothetical protein MUP99_04910 [Pedobacter sp.]|nr:hypothetical protein [Pedobacter sp.]
MKTSININLPEDFTTVCTIYQINPETFIQAFIGEVSFPTFYSRPTATDRWATFFFLNLLRKVDVSIHINQELEDEYLNKFNLAMQSSFDILGSDETAAQAAGRRVMKDWMKAVVAERARYLTDLL